MLIWDEAQTICQDFTGDTSSPSLTTFKRFMNLGYKDILHTFTGEETEDVRTTTTQTGIRAIKLLPNYARIHTVTATVGNREYVVHPEESQEKWAERINANQTSSRPTVYFIRPRFGTGGAELLLDPIPSDTSTTIRIYYGATARDLSVAKYTTGTVALANDSPTVTGTDTTFSLSMEGRYFRVEDETGDGMWYRITDYTNGTSITLENDYHGTDISGKSYTIAEAFALPEDLQMGPVYFAMWHFYAGVRKDKEELRNHYWRDEYRRIKLMAEQNYKRKGKSNLIDTEKEGTSPWPVYPGYFPESTS